MSPGLPDLYQGQELWDFSLVDPDNRRSVDYDLRKWLLAEIRSQCQTDIGRMQLAQHLAANPRDQRTKLFVVWTLLQARRETPWSAGAPQFIPLEVAGEQQRNLIAFALRGSSGDDAARTIVLCPILTHRLFSSFAETSPSGEPWQGAAVKVDHTFDGLYRNSLTAERVEVRDGRLPVPDALATLPIAVLNRVSSQTGNPADIEKNQTSGRAT
jgi:(1->4)-alpha-D-glucan 1-alpha-D-glucosylmutase